VKFSQILVRPTKSGNLQRWSAVWSFSLTVSAIMLSLIFLVGGASQLAAQSVTSGDIVGLVTDPSGAVVSNASVTLKSQENGSTEVQFTNARGVYRFSLLPPGRYTVSVAADGFQKADATAVVTIGQAATINIPLTLGEVSCTVEVTSDAPLLQTEDSDVSTSSAKHKSPRRPTPATT
jgi:hypothetical protein